MHIIASSPFLDSLEHIAGFLVVLVALTLLWILTATIGKIFLKMGLVSPAPGQTHAAPDGEDGPGEEEVAAIAACVVAILGRRSRIVSIRRGRSTDWNREGRREHFSSRRIR
jgi:hypothetical protein